MATPPTPAPLRIVAAAGFLILLGLALQTASFTAVVALPRDARLVAAVLLMPLLCVLIAVAICDSARVAPGLPRALYGIDARSVRVPSTIAGVILYVAVGMPVLAWLTDLVGLTGTTSLPLEHRAPWFVLAVAVTAVLVAPWLEEVSVRGLLLEGLWIRFGFWPAAFLSALIWAALHEVGGVLILFTGLGVVLAWVRRRTGSVRVGIVLHTLQNTVATAVSGAIWLAIALFGVQAVLMVLTREEGRDRATERFRAAVGWASARAGALAAATGRSLLPAGRIELALAVAFQVAVLARLGFAATGVHGWRVAGSVALVAVGAALIVLAGSRRGLAGIDPAPAAAGVVLGGILVVSCTLAAAGLDGARGFSALGLVGLGWWMLGVARRRGEGQAVAAAVAGAGALLSVLPLLDINRETVITQVLAAATVSAAALLVWACRRPA